MTNKEARAIWPMLSLKRDHQIGMSNQEGIKLLDIDIEVLIFIQSHGRVTTNKIYTTKYFRVYGFSTIKRAVDKLYKNRVISKTVDTLDSRKRILELIT